MAVMPTRREVLLRIGAAPVAGVLARHSSKAVPVQPEIFEEPHCLSQESAKGFRLLLSRNTPLSRNVIILPASRELSRQMALQLRRQVEAGAWLIVESGLAFAPSRETAAQIRVLRDVFGIETRPALPHPGGYIEYSWPMRRLVRDFSAITPVECSRSERIAESQGVAAGAKRFLGNGGLIFLGSMLGPALLAAEREAHELGSAMLGTLDSLYARAL